MGGSGLSLRNVEKVYTNDKHGIQALDNISIDIESGSVTGILGPNGAGKTTLIKCILGLIEPSGGTISMNGNAKNNSKPSYQDVAAVLEGARNIYWRLSVLENMRFFSSVSGNNPKNQTKYFEKLLNNFDIIDKKNVPVRELSRGQKQKASILCALAREPEIVFLDEPTLGLDIKSSVRLREELNKMSNDRGYTIIISSHDMNTIQSICDKVIMLIDGEIAISATVDELLDRFEHQIYRITIDGGLSEDQKQRLEQMMNARSFEEFHSITQFKFETTSSEFFDTVLQLRSLDITVKKLNSVEPNIKDIFLDVIDGESSEDVNNG